jgi:hypothetical protein
MSILKTRNVYTTDRQVSNRIDMSIDVRNVNQVNRRKLSGMYGRGGKVIKAETRQKERIAVHAAGEGDSVL